MQLVERKDDDRPVVDRRADAPRRAAGDAAAPAPAARRSRPHPRAHRRGELRVRTIVDEDSRRIVRTLVNRLLLVLAGTAFLAVSALLLVASDPGPASSPGRPACSRSSATAACWPAPCSCCGSSPPSRGTARHERRSQRCVGHRAVGAGDAFDDRPPGERYYRHPGDVVRLVVWGLATLVLVLFIELADGTNAGLREDLGDAWPCIPAPSGSSPLAVAQFAAILVPVSSSRRSSLGGAGAGSSSSPGAAAGAAPSRCSIAPFGDPRARRRALDDDSWLISARFPRRCLPRRCRCRGDRRQAVAVAAWRRSADRWLVVVAVAMAIAGTAGLAELLLAVAAGQLAGAAVLVVVGAPNRRPSRLPSPTALDEAGLPVTALDLAAVAGGRSQLYRATLADGTHASSRSTPRTAGTPTCCTAATARSSCASPVTTWPARRSSATSSTKASCCCWPGERACACPDAARRRPAPRRVDGPGHGRRRRAPARHAGADELDAELLDAVWTEAARAARRRDSPTGRCARPTSSSTDDGPVIVDFGAPRRQRRAAAAGDRPGRAARLAGRHSSARGRDGGRGAHAAGRATSPPRSPFLQPLASVRRRRAARPRSRCSRTLRDAHRDGRPAREPEPLERLVRVRPRTLVMIATLTGAFYFLLPQLANVDDSIEALRSANWAWLAGCVVMSGVTYVAAASAWPAASRERLPSCRRSRPSWRRRSSTGSRRPTSAAWRSTSATMQKAGVPPAEAVTGVGLNVARRRDRPRRAARRLLRLGGPRAASGVPHPEQQHAARRHRRPARPRSASPWRRAGVAGCCSHARRAGRPAVAAPASARSPARRDGCSRCSAARWASRSPTSLALACAATAFDGGVSFAQVGAVYLGSSLIAAAAPTPGGLGRDGGGARRRVHRRRHGRGDRRGRRCSATAW